MLMAKRGRPRKVEVKNLIDGVDAYLENTSLPIVAEYAQINHITADYLYELARKETAEGRPELSRSIKRITDQKAIVLEKGALIGKFSSSMAIFSLKQLGWRDRPEEKSEAAGVTIIDDFK